MSLPLVSNKNIPPTVFILLDAFRWDYLQAETAPVLWQLKEEGIYAKKLRPSFGFCEIAESSTGVRPNQSGLFTQLTFAKTQHGRIQSTYLKLIEQIATWVELYGGRGSTRLTNLLTKDFITPLFADQRVDNLRYNIPLRLLPLLSAVEARRYTEPNAFDIESCFDVLTKNGKRTYDDVYVINSKVSGTDESRVATLIEKAQHDFDLFMIYLGGCDEFGHRFGPNSEELQDIVSQQDRWINQLIKAFPPATRFLIVGDHGMLPVTDTIDIGTTIRQALSGFKHARDYILFLDSTLARVWWHNERAGEALREIFAAPPISQKGKIIDVKEAQRLAIPPPGERYGQLIWRANPGVMVFPDYFNNKVPLGMHGYPTHLDEQKGMAILWGQNIPSAEIDEIELIDLCPTICELFELSPPATNQGHSLFDQVG
ncbi:MAG: hypothetical protein HOH77_03300 [Candidatus Latescibacteria bacterium]|nr:hypothetical protein [Candidatus Latescibacterota bacterium]